jgi:hemolysin III
VSIRTEPFNTLSHLIGAVLNGVVALTLAFQILNGGQAELAAGMVLFGFCMSGSYLASVLYHSAGKAERRAWLRWDRAGINLAIAGFHTVNALASLSPEIRTPYLVVIWGFALYFISRELRCNPAKDSSGVLGFLVTGVSGIVGWMFLAMTPQEQGLMWLGIVTLMFTVGVVLLRCSFIPANHEMWHVMVLMGNMCMFVWWNDLMTTG